MSASDDIWILGISMTKFGKHPDQDIVDLGAEAIMAALADAGVTMADMAIASRIDFLVIALNTTRSIFLSFRAFLSLKTCSTCHEMASPSRSGSVSSCRRV